LPQNKIWPKTLDNPPRQKYHEVKNIASIENICIPPGADGKREAAGRLAG
jgi:hypothetical protein